MKNMATTWMVLVLTALCMSGCSRDGGAPRNRLATAEETVRAYCDLDAEGVRLTSATWNKVLPYIEWSEEAGFDRAVVIGGYRIASAEKAGERQMSVTVEYAVLGMVSGKYLAGRRTEAVRFKVERTDRGWKITDPDFLPPHVLAAKMAEHLAATKKLETAEDVRKGIKE